VLFDIHATLRRKKYADATLRRVDHETEIHLVRKRDLLLDPEASDCLTLDARVGMDTDEIGHFVRGRSETYAASLTATACTHLRLHRPCACTFQLHVINGLRIDENASRYGNASATYKFFRIVLK
jgi:hypothetical protein